MAEPAVADAPPPSRRDVALMVAILVSATVEALLRTDLLLPWFEWFCCIVVAPAVVWRRSYPLQMTLSVFLLINTMTLVGALFDKAPLGLYTMATVLVFPYALFRWGSGRQAALACPVFLASWLIGITVDPGNVGDAIGGLIVLLCPIVLGLMVRFRATAHHRELAEVRSREREQLARELHDTVAHHVSAIAIQAQAARTIAPVRPDEALGILAVIEDAASRTLSEMRTMVGSLRQDEEAALAPRPGIADLNRLADESNAAINIEVRTIGDLDAAEPLVDAAVFRIAQESITNALRHAAGATVVEVEVVGSPERVELVIRDDGEPSSDLARPPGTRYGLLGMAERAKLLGGTFEAGPQPGGGWRVAASLPRSGALR